MVYLWQAFFVLMFLWYIGQAFLAFRRSKTFHARHAVYCHSIISPVYRGYAYSVLGFVFLSVIVLLAYYQRVGAVMDSHLVMAGAPMLLLTIGTRGSKVYEVADEGILLQRRVYSWREVGYVHVIKRDEDAGNYTYLIKLILTRKPARVWIGTTNEETKDLIMALCYKHKVIVQDEEKDMRYA